MVHGKETFRAGERVKRLLAHYRSLAGRFSHLIRLHMNCTELVLNAMKCEAKGWGARHAGRFPQRLS